MESPESDIVRKAEAILASAKKFKGDRRERYELMKQVDLLYLELEDPMDASEPPSITSHDQLMAIFSAQAMVFCKLCFFHFNRLDTDYIAAADCTGKTSWLTQCR